MNLHEFLDCHFGPEGAAVLRRKIAEGDDPNVTFGPQSETALHVAVRRRRLSAVEILLESGAEIDAQTAGGKTAYAHAVRRNFTEVAAFLAGCGADQSLNEADRLAVAIGEGRLDDARNLLADHPDAARTGNPEEDRLLADVAGRHDTEAVQLLLEAGADLAATGLDDGTPLHQAAWFGQTQVARLLIDAGAPLEVFDATHQSSPLGWAVHGSRFSGGAAGRQDVYVAIIEMLLDAGAKLHDPDQPHDDSYRIRLLTDASPAVAEVLRRQM